MAFHNRVASSIHLIPFSSFLFTFIVSYFNLCKKQNKTTYISAEPNVK